MSNITTVEIGRVAGLFRYPVKSMIGTAVISATLAGTDWRVTAGLHFAA